MTPASQPSLAPDKPQNSVSGVRFHSGSRVKRPSGHIRTLCKAEGFWLALRGPRFTVSVKQKVAEMNVGFRRIDIFPANAKVIHQACQAEDRFLPRREIVARLLEDREAKGLIEQAYQQQGYRVSLVFE